MTLFMRLHRLLPLRWGFIWASLLLPAGLAWSQPVFTIAVTPGQPIICLNSQGVLLTASPSSGTPTLPLSYQWTPATDLSNDTIANPLAFPTTTTTYTVIATDAQGDTASASVTVIVQAPPSANIVPPGDQCLGQPVNFSLTGYTPGDSLSWDFGTGASPPGSTDTLPPPVTYNTPGPRTVTLTVSNLGCGTTIDTLSFTVHEVNAALQTSNFGCTGSPVSFFDLSTSSDSLSSWLWDFGDGTQALVANPAHLYTNAAVYPVSLIVTTQAGCADTATALLDVFAVPVAAFTDSLVDCQTVIFTNQSPPAAYFWDFGDSTFSIQASPVHTYQDTGTFAVTYITSNLCGTDTAQQSYYIGAQCVWPGDANNDLIANNVDILSLGLLWGQSGPSRPSASLDWRGQGAPSWGLTLPGSGGLDAAFADTDGSGFIDAADTLAIALNYGLTHNKHQATSQTGPLLYFDTTAIVTPVLAGSLVTLPIMLGTPAAPADSSYGLAFTVQYEPDLVDSASARVRAPVSWLGPNLLTFDRDFYPDGAVPAAVTRTDQLMVPGAGQVAQFTFVMIDDIARQGGHDTLDLDFSGIILLDARGHPIPVQHLPARIPVTQVANRLPDPVTVTIFPNPAQRQVLVRGQPGQRLRVILSDLQGRPMGVTTSGLSPLPIDLETLATGCYLLHIETTSGRQVALVQKAAE